MLRAFLTVIITASNDWLARSLLLASFAPREIAQLLDGELSSYLHDNDRTFELNFKLSPPISLHSVSVSVCRVQDNAEQIQIRYNQSTSTLNHVSSQNWVNFRWLSSEMKGITRCMLLMMVYLHPTMKWKWSTLVSFLPWRRTSCRLVVAFSWFFSSYGPNNDRTIPDSSKRIVKVSIRIHMRTSWKKSNYDLSHLSHNGDVWFSFY